jgi:predicted RNA-binding protein with PUA-like domain
MKVFIFQSLVDRYDLRDKIEPSKKDIWYATRYRNELEVGDIVFFWMGGKKELTGIYGWGKIISEPYHKDNWESYGIDVQYEYKFQSPIHISLLKKDKTLKELMVIRAPIGTNFLVTKEQANRLLQVIESMNEKSPKID